jgi:hypothetical protein
MDLQKISFHEVEIQCEIKEGDVSMLEAGGYVRRQYLGDINTVFDIFHLDNNDAVAAHISYIHNELDDDLKIYYKCAIVLSNGRYYEESFFKYGVIPLMTFEELQAWQVPRNVNVKMKVGFYWGTGGDQFDQQNILIDIEDFVPICSPPSFHTNSMDVLLNSGKFSDVTLVCNDNKTILAHKCLLLASPYFSALFGDNFGQEAQKLVNVEYDICTMRIVVSFVYSGRVQEEDVCNWQALYQAALFYQMENLARHCELQLMTRVSRQWDSIRELIRFASTFYAVKLKKFLIRLTRNLQETT